MNTNPRHLTTAEERERFSAARHRGGLCAGCGRTLDGTEPVYIGMVALDIKWSNTPDVQLSRRTVYREGPLGAECAASDFLVRAGRVEPEPCEGCGRPVHYAVNRAGRYRTFCSRRCSSRANHAARSKSKSED